MSEKPNPSLDCARLVRFSALPLYHGGELQSCWAVIRSSSLLQTPLPGPVHHTPHPSPSPPFPLDNKKKKVFIFFSSLLCPVFTSASLRICLVGKREKKTGTSSLQKPTRRNSVGGAGGGGMGDGEWGAGTSVAVINRGFDGVKGACMYVAPSPQGIFFFFLLEAYVVFRCVSALILGSQMFSSRRAGPDNPQ